MSLRIAFALALLILPGLMLIGCGKKGSPSVPGPPEEVVFPKSYPSR